MALNTTQINTTITPAHPASCHPITQSFVSDYPPTFINDTTPLCGFNAPYNLSESKLTCASLRLPPSTIDPGPPRSYADVLHPADCCVESTVRQYGNCSIYCQPQPHLGRGIDVQPDFSSCLTHHANLMLTAATCNDVAKNGAGSGAAGLVPGSGVLGVWILSIWIWMMLR